MQIDNTENVIDSRDIIDRIAELEALLPEGQQSDDEVIEFAILKSVVAQCEGYGDWEYGEALIRESYFTEYAQQIVEDCCTDMPDMTQWPWKVKGVITVNWEVVAESLKQDYTEVDFNGVTYFMRS